MADRATDDADNEGNGQNAEHNPKQVRVKYIHGGGHHALSHLR